MGRQTDKANRTGDSMGRTGQAGTRPGAMRPDRQGGGAACRPRQRGGTGRWAGLLAVLALLGPGAGGWSAALGGVGALTAAAPAAAQDSGIRRVGVPAPGSTNRITVQINPLSPPRPSAALPPAAPPRAGQAASSAGAAPRSGSAVPGAGVGGGTGGADWFWAGVSPRLADSRPGRLGEALAALGRAPSGQGFSAPRLQALQEIARQHGTDILRATVGTRVSPALVLAVIAVESAGNPAAVSRAGAGGLMQLMPATAERFGVRDRFAAGENIRGGVAYLDWLLGHFGGDPILALAAYNAGEGAVRSNGGVPPYAETRAYVPKVLTAWTVARGLCRTPPELLSDGCVFAVSAF